MSEERLDVVFTAPHPDDLEICCGGAIARLVRQGYRVGMVHLTDGEPTPRGTREQRLAEAGQAAAVLGAQVWEVLDLPNRELMDGPAARYALAAVLRRHRPRVLVGLAGRTPAASPDHYQAQMITEGARFYSQLTKWDARFDGTEPHRIEHLVYRPVPRSAERLHFPASFVVDISDVIERKLEAVACYRSQFDGDRWARLKHFVTSVAGAEGGLAGFAYGELYSLPRPLSTADLVGLLGS